MTTDPLDAVLVRYLTGRALLARAGAFPFLGLRTLAVRWLVPLAAALVAVAWVTHPEATRTGLLVGLVLGAAWLRRRWRRGRFHRAYVSPTMKAIAVPVGTASITLKVDRGLGRLVARLARPLSPMEQALRERYGRWVEPVWRVPTDHVLAWTDRLYAPLAPVLARVHTWVTPPRERHGPRIVLSIAAPFVTSEQRSMISAIVRAKIPAGDTVESWDQVGAEVTATWVPRKRPPSKVGLAELERYGADLPDDQFYLGQAAGDVPVVVSVKADSPHFAVSAGSGAGKSVLAVVLAAQVLRRGGRVVVLDRKASHRPLLDLPGVTYCPDPESMHNALVREAQLADDRNRLALYEPEDWDPGQRVLIICEELNSTITQLTNWWAANRERHDPKKSPAVTGLIEISCMGRAAKYHLVAVAQQLTARAAGGGEARENFSLRALARFTRNSWLMLVPEIPMPRPSRTVGRWQICVGGVATETQIAYLTPAQIRAYACVTGHADGLDGALSSDVPGNATKPVTLAEAIAGGIVPWSKAATKMRLRRARAAGRTVPTPVGRRGLQAELYDPAELADWARAEATA